MKKIITLGTVCIFLICSCNSKEFVKHNFHTEMAQYEVVYPLKFNNKTDNYIEVKNYLSKYDTIKLINKDRFPILYLFVEDTIIGDNNEILSLIENNKINYAEYSVDDEKFKIPEKLLNGKRGQYKLTVAIIDLIIGDTIKADPYIVGDEDKLDIDFIDSRSYHDIIIE